LADGAHDVHSHLDLSGEPLLPDLEKLFTLRPQMPLSEYQDLTLQGLECESAYSDYWNSTSAEDGQIVDAVIMPVAPHAAVIPGKFYHTGTFCHCHVSLHGTDHSGIVTMLMPCVW
jgi:amidase